VDAKGQPARSSGILIGALSGIAAALLRDGQLAIRAAIVNHRTDTCDIDALVSAVLEFGARRSPPGAG